MGGDVSLLIDPGRLFSVVCIDPVPGVLVVVVPDGARKSPTN